jgi:hypothetical protein
MLLPALARAKERAKRTSCTNSLRQQCLASLMEAGDNSEVFANDGQEAPYYIGGVYRDKMVAEYKIPRASYYCPSNPGWNKQDNSFWYFPSGSSVSDPAVIGYFYFAGYPGYNNPSKVDYYYPNGGGLPDGTNVRDHMPLFAIKTTDRPYYNLLWTDINAQYLGSWIRENNLYDGEVRRANHFERRGPVGANEGYTDGHVEWVKFAKFSKIPRMQYASLDIFFYGNR